MAVHVGKFIKGDYVHVVKFIAGDYVHVTKFMGEIMSMYTNLSRGDFVLGWRILSYTHSYPVCKKICFKKKRLSLKKWKAKNGRD